MKAKVSKKHKYIFILFILFSILLYSSMSYSEIVSQNMASFKKNENLIGDLFCSTLKNRKPDKFMCYLKYTFIYNRGNSYIRNREEILKNLDESMRTFSKQICDKTPRVLPIEFRDRKKLVDDYCNQQSEEKFKEMLTRSGFNKNNCTIALGYLEFEVKKNRFNKNSYVGRGELKGRDFEECGLVKTYELSRNNKVWSLKINHQTTINQDTDWCSKLNYSANLSPFSSSISGFSCNVIGPAIGHLL